jgi:hypothetical protein
MSDTRRNRTDVTDEKARGIPSGVRNLIMVLACGGLLFGIAALREPRHSQARIVPVAPTPEQAAEYLELLSRPVSGKLLGSVQGQNMNIEIYSARGTTLFRPLDSQGRPLTPALSAGELSARYPLLDLKSLLASFEHGKGLMLAEPRSGE